MSRIRTVKPQFFISSDMCALSIGARLLYIGLWTLCDREGCFKFNIWEITCQLMPDQGEKVVEGYLRELVMKEHVQKLEVIGRITTFKTHQKVNPQEKTSVLVHDANRIAQKLSNVYAWEGKGKEGKGSIYVQNEILHDNMTLLAEKEQQPTAEANDTQSKQVSLTPLEKKRAAPIIDIDALFTEFWSLYPRHRNRFKAFKQYQYLVAVVGADILLDGLKRAVKEWEDKQTESAYIPLANTWLKDRRWEDDLSFEGEHSPENKKTAPPETGSAHATNIDIN